MINPLLDRALPKELAKRGQVFDMTGKIEDFQRLTEIAEEELSAVEPAKHPREWQAAPVNIRLEFGWADAGGDIPALRGEIVTKIAAVCQRCLEPFELPLRATLNMLLLRSADANTAQGEFEIWEVEEDLIRPFDIVEESLIMVLPLSALHQSHKKCGPLLEDLASDDNETVRPFADLRSRMNETN